MITSVMSMSKKKRDKKTATGSPRCTHKHELAVCNREKKKKKKSSQNTERGLILSLRKCSWACAGTSAALRVKPKIFTQALLRISVSADGLTHLCGGPSAKKKHTEATGCQVLVTAKIDTINSGFCHHQWDAQRSLDGLIYNTQFKPAVLSCNGGNKWLCLQRRLNS